MQFIISLYVLLVIVFLLRDWINNCIFNNINILFSVLISVRQSPWWLSAVLPGMINQYQVGALYNWKEIVTIENTFSWKKPEGNSQ